jgi:hypothetical protein
MANNFIKQFFNKSSEALLLEDIREFFVTPQEETSILEFKSGQVEIDDIYKEVAAFLNTEGGLLIIGSPKESRKPIGKNTITQCQGALTFSNFRNKDWLLQKIATNVTPSPSGIKIRQFNEPEGSVYLIDIPQSTTPPHQVNSEGRYYIRMEAEAKPAPHGLVQALFQKRNKPNISAGIKVTKGSGQENHISVTFHNDSSTPAYKVSVLIDVINVIKVQSNFEFRTVQDEYLGKKFSFHDSTNKVLVRVINLTYKFTVFHKSNNYLIHASFWGKNSDYDSMFWTYDPMKNEIVNKGEFYNSELTIIEAYDQLK